MRVRCSHILVAGLLLALGIGTPLLAIAHVALEGHSYCAEHERLEEAQDAHVGSDQRGAVGDGDGSARLFAAASGDPGDSHLGCGFADFFALECLHPTAAVSLAGCFGAIFKLPADIRASNASGIAILRLAPKSSPPRFA